MHCVRIINCCWTSSRVLNLACFHWKDWMLESVEIRHWKTEQRATDPTPNLFYFAGIQWKYSACWVYVHWCQESLGGEESAADGRRRVEPVTFRGMSTYRHPALEYADGGSSGTNFPFRSDKVIHRRGHDGRQCHPLPRSGCNWMHFCVLKIFFYP